MEKIQHLCQFVNCMRVEPVQTHLVVDIDVRARRRRRLITAYFVVAFPFTPFRIQEPTCAQQRLTKRNKMKGRQETHTKQNKKKKTCDHVYTIFDRMTLFYYVICDEAAATRGPRIVHSHRRRAKQKGILFCFLRIRNVPVRHEVAEISFR